MEKKKVNDLQNQRLKIIIISNHLFTLLIDMTLTHSHTHPKADPLALTEPHTNTHFHTHMPQHTDTLTEVHTEKTLLSFAVP